MPTRRRPSPVSGHATRGSRARLLAARRSIQSQRHVIDALHHIATLTLDVQPLPDILQVVVQEVSAATGFPIVAIELYDAVHQLMEVAAATGIPLPNDQASVRVAIDQTLSGLVARTGQVLIERHAQTRPEDADPVLRQLGVETFVGLPLIVADQVIGALSLAHPDAAPLDDDLVPLAQSLAHVTATLIARRRGEEDLRRSAQTYRALFDSIDAGFCIIEVLFDGDMRPVDYRFLDVNAAFEQQTGIPNAVGRCMRNIAPQHEAHWFELYGRIAMTGEPLRFENRAEALGRFYDVYAFRIGAPEERRVAIRFNDITARKAAEDALQRSERTFRTLYESMRDAFVVVDMPGRILQYNQSFQDLLGYSADELAQLTYHDITPVQWHAMEARIIQEDVLTRGYSALYEKEYRRKDGTIVPIELRAVLIRDEHDQPAGLWGLIRDITERRRAENLVTAQRDLARLIASTTDPAVAWPRCLELAVRVCGMDCGGLYLFDDTTQTLELVAHQGLSAGFVQAAARYPRASASAQLLLADTSAYLSVVDLQQRAPFQYETLSCVAVMPIHSQGQVLGCVNLGSHTLPEVPAFARHALETIAPEIGNIVVALRTFVALRAEQVRLARVADTVPGTITTFLLRPDGTLCIPYASRAFDDLYGLTRADVAESIAALIARIPTEQVERLIAAVGESAQTLRPWRQEYQYAHPSKGTIWLEAYSMPVREPDGSTVWYGVTTDITERKQAEAQLRALNQTLEERVAQRTAEVQDLYDHAPVGYHSLDRDGKLVRVNQTEIDWLGYTRAELIGRRISDLMTLVSQAAVPAHFAQLLAQGWLRDFEVELIRKDGSTFPALINATALYDEVGTFVMTRSTLTDLTLRKQAEAALRESGERLRLSEARLQLLLAKTPAVIFSSLAEPDFRSTFISESVRQVLGYEPAQFLGSPGFWAQRIHPDDKPRVFGDAAQLIAQGWRQYEYRCRHADGSYRWVESGVSLLPAVEGHPAEVVGYMIDITPRKQAEALLRHANAELARAARDKDAFLANMSHELRTPLNAILGFSEILRAEIRGPLNSSQQAALQSIEISGQHLLAMITDILDLAKGEAGRLVLQPDRVWIAEVCKASLLFVKEQALKNGVHLDVQIDDPDASIQADPRRLKQMLVNLLANAVKFTPRGGQVILAVTIDVAAGLVQFRVEDTGIGIASEDLGRLFQPFSQLDSALSRQQVGTGLGLALVHRLAELHGGEVRVASTVGVGSCFTITLPVLQPALITGEPTRGLPSTAPGESGAVGPVRPQVLVADDNEDNLLMVAEYLQAKGYAVAVARSGREALSQVAAVHPAVILMDIQMPDLDGLAVIRQLRTQAAWATTPIIALTALAMPGDQERCLNAGASAYVTKPVRFQELQETIRRLLNAD